MYNFFQSDYRTRFGGSFGDLEQGTKIIKSKKKNYQKQVEKTSDAGPCCRRDGPRMQLCEISRERFKEKFCFRGNLAFKI